ncbi:Os09g0438400 [Oryza sativa Japonica Group]|uniref:ethanolamine kinase n=1 Tax=Oryza sativa subsp. japonica TaxID=39947 RepID=Q0J1I2_ORYSJ|nr:Os09g0438400 [Oryza sativa Japonica Group]|eukprot:NP_001063269.1 Os09g0438400 [Oryza sativa Japonica Group]
MGSEGRSWSGAAAVGGGVEGEAAIAAVVAPAPGDVPASGASVDIALPLPEMTPRIMRRYLQGIGEGVVIAGQLALLDRDGVWRHHEYVKLYNLLSLKILPIYQKLSGNHNCNLLLAVLKVSAEDGKGNKSSVTVRLYGPNTDLVIDRKRELQAIPHLSAAGFGAQLLGTFENGMVQSFIYARTLTPSDMKEPRIAAEIAKEIRRFHQVDIPGSKEPQLWDDIFKFMKKASILEFEDKEKQKRYETISFRKIQDEVKELKKSSTSLISSMGRTATVVMILQTISMNMQAMIATIACIQIKILNTTSSGTIFNLIGQVQLQDLDALYVETNTYRLASHIYWALWALIQAKVSPIDFDYLGYFFLRYDEYKKQRESCLSLAESSLSALKNG